VTIIKTDAKRGKEMTRDKLKTWQQILNTGDKTLLTTLNRNNTMSNITTIRHKTIDTGFIQVTSYWEGSKFKVVLQQYRLWEHGLTSLDSEILYHSEESAVKAFEFL
jgi:hypothetical protein